MPWLRLLTDDLQVLSAAFGARFYDLPPPEIDLEPWCAIMREFPSEWKAMIKEWNYPESVYDTSARAVSSHFGVNSFACRLCTVDQPVFASQRALASHMRCIHGIRNPYRAYVNDSGTCPVCGTLLHTRLRVIAHLSDPRRNLACRQAILDGEVPALCPHEVARLDALDTIARREA
eukprot:9042973-Karenia_brevis.AAC.1